MRCGFCHDEIEDVAALCFGCGASLHDDCWGELGRCPTLGCERRPAGLKRLLWALVVAVGGFAFSKQLHDLSQPRSNLACFFEDPWSCAFEHQGQRGDCLALTDLECPGCASLRRDQLSPRPRWAPNPRASSKSRAPIRRLTAEDRGLARTPRAHPEAGPRRRLWASLSS